MNKYSTTQYPITAIVKWPSLDSISIKGIKGYVKMTQNRPNADVHIEVNIKGLKPNTLHGFHIHESPVTSILDLNKKCGGFSDNRVNLVCDSCKGHFNPLNQDHGSIFNTDKPRNKRHVGDLINNIKANELGHARFLFNDELVSLYPTIDKPYSVIGCSLVIHRGIDDLGRKGTTPIMPYLNPKTGKPVLGSNINKTIPYQNIDLRKSSIINGNAGERIACGNIK